MKNWKLFNEYSLLSEESPPPICEGDLSFLSLLITSCLIISSIVSVSDTRIVNLDSSETNRRGVIRRREVCTNHEVTIEWTFPLIPCGFAHCRTTCKDIKDVRYTDDPPPLSFVIGFCHELRNANTTVVHRSGGLPSTCLLIPITAFIVPWRDMGVVSWASLFDCTTISLALRFALALTCPVLLVISLLGIHKLESCGIRREQTVEMQCEGLGISQRVKWWNSAAEQRSYRSSYPPWA